MIVTLGPEEPQVVTKESWGHWAPLSSPVTVASYFSVLGTWLMFFFYFYFYFLFFWLMFFKDFL